MRHTRLHRQLQQLTNPLTFPHGATTPQSAYDWWEFDCDGTLWKGNTLIPGAKEALQMLRDQARTGARVQRWSMKQMLTRPAAEYLLQS